MILGMVTSYFLSSDKADQACMNEGKEEKKGDQFDEQYILSSSHEDLLPERISFKTKFTSISIPLPSPRTNIHGSTKRFTQYGTLLYH